MPLDEARAKARFMREVGATHTSWNGDDLTSLTLAPVAVQRPVGPAASMGDMQKRLEAAAQKQHDIMFAASSVKPKLEAPQPRPAVVPRAVRAKLEAAQRGEIDG
jgi:hypothetical protein